MKVLFLDVDGVVNSDHTRQRHQGFIGIDPELAAKVKRIVKETDCKIVLSSVWRLYETSRKEVIRKVGPYIDVTPDMRGNIRGVEIKAWLDNHSEVERYAILDDDDDFIEGQPLFKTTWLTGLTDEIADKVIGYLNEVRDEL